MDVVFVRWSAVMSLTKSVTAVLALLSSSGRGTVLFYEHKRLPYLWAVIVSTTLSM